MRAHRRCDNEWEAKQRQEWVWARKREIHKEGCKESGEMNCCSFASSFLVRLIRRIQFHSQSRAIGAHLLAQRSQSHRRRRNKHRLNQVRSDNSIFGQFSNEFPSNFQYFSSKFSFRSNLKFFQFRFHQFSVQISPSQRQRESCQPTKVLFCVWMRIASMRYSICCRWTICVRWAERAKASMRWPVTFSNGNIVILRLKFTIQYLWWWISPKRNRSHHQTPRRNKHRSRIQNHHWSNDSNRTPCQICKLWNRNRVRWRAAWFQWPMPKWWNVLAILCVDGTC